MASLVRIACSNLDAAIEEPRAERPAGHSYALWTLHEQAAGSRQRVWRIREFLGAESTEYRGAQVSEGGENPSPDVLVLDDQDLGFRNDSAGWPAALRQGGNPRRIILRTCTPLGEGLLWKTLLGSYADRLDVVVSVSALRARGASISQSLSWDRTIKETVAEFEAGISASDLALVRRVVVHFGSAGAASLTRLAPRAKSAGALLDRVSLERFLYHPDDQETDWEVRHPGATLDGSAILVASLVRHELGPESYPQYIALGRGLV
ncbi:MAG: hypothetical protein WCB19_03625, partial [Thermoplasmata archaeon]